MFGNLLWDWDEGKESLEEFNARIKGTLESLEKDFQAARKEYLEKTGNVREKLAKAGWFLPNYTRYVLSRELRDMRALASRTNDEIDEFCCEFYQQRLEKIRDEIGQAFPDRKNAIGEAIEAHQQQKYFLSVPVFLSQADGIFAEYSQTFGVFAREGQYPKSKKWLEALILNDDFVISYMKPFCMVTALNMSQNERTNAGITINRHAVLHGEWIDYGTYINSLKALSFFYFVATAIDCLKMEEMEEGHN